MHRSGMLVAAAVTGVALLAGAPSCGEGEPSSPAPQEQQTGGWHRGDSAYLIPIAADIRIDVRAG